MLTRQDKAMQRVYSDKLKRQQRAKVEREATERAIAAREKYLAEKAAEKAEAERIAEKKPFDDEVTLRLEKLQTKLKGDN